jgi:hypothetical protein
MITNSEQLQVHWTILTPWSLVCERFIHAHKLPCFSFLDSDSVISLPLSHCKLIWCSELKHFGVPYLYQHEQQWVWISLFIFAFQDLSRFAPFLGITKALFGCLDQNGLNSLLFSFQFWLGRDLDHVRQAKIQVRPVSKPAQNWMFTRSWSPWCF